MDYCKVDDMSKIVSNLNIKVDSLGFQKEGKNAVCGKRTIDDYEIIYNIDGISYITINDELFTLNSGDMIVIPPFVPHKIDTDTNNPHSNFWVHFDINQNTFSSKVMSLILKSWGSNKVSLGLDKDLLRLLENMQWELQKQESYNYIMINTLFLQFVIIILKKTDVNLKNDIDINRVESYNVFSTVQRYIENNFMKIKSVDEVCKKNSISVSYCNKLFNKNLKITPAKYILQVKLKEGARLLKYSDKKILEISQILSFPNQYHFSNTFKKYYLLSPSEYRKNNFNC